MKESESVKEYSDRLVGIADIRVLGTDLRDDRLVQKILVSLPEKFEATIASLENTRDLADIKLAELLNALRTGARVRLMRRKDHVEGALQAKSFRCWKRLDARCRRCHKLGHMEAICKGKAYQQTGEAQVVVSEVDEEHLFVASAGEYSVENSTWLIDSGCTNNMTSNLELFKSKNKTVKSKVRIGNGQHIEVQGKGVVAVKGNQGVKLIRDVLFVPNIDQNLLSVGQLVEKGYIVKFEGRECLIKDTDSNEVLRVQMRDKSFVFKPNEMQQMALKCT
ncbi:uncharacterized protein LOC120293987 [Eucalyptus grandis]|uniref:uncharacterized protein LOC120293987 n=1 Tax=Eucalyptus grandis TaxID=71139 RepID=UPI00192E96B1|nr:uncharacterized protein LOC120293987 [Eucalyptus grandis]